MTSQLLLAGTRKCGQRWIPPPRGDLLKLPGHQFHIRMIGKENSTGPAPKDSGPYVGRSIYISGYQGVRRAREDLSHDACRGYGVKVLNRDVGALEEHPGPNGVVKKMREPSSGLARGRPTAVGINSRQWCTPSQKMRRKSM